MATNFYLEKRTDKQGEAPVRVSFSFGGVRYLTSTGLKVSPDRWDGEKQVVKRGATSASGMSWSAINGLLAKMRSFFQEYENECMLENHKPDKEWLKGEFARKFGRQHQEVVEVKEEPEVKEVGFWDYYNMFVLERSETNGWTAATHEKFHALKGHISAWRPKGLSFDDFTEAGFGSFMAFLRDTRKLKNSTIGKQVGFLKWFLRWAALKGYNSNMAFQSFSPKLKVAAKKVVFLDWDELMRVFNFEVPEDGKEVTLLDVQGKEYTKIVHASNGLRITRDVFCFCCFTSLRFSDASNLKLSNISNGSMTITTVKTADTITIELNKYAQAVLKRYEGVDLGGYALPHITNQRMNMYLKDLCELCGINELVTRTYYRGSERVDETRPKYELMGTHAGRRTFICNALMLGIPAEIVMKWTGHADYKSMKPYIDVTNAAKAREMGKFDEL